MGVYIKEGISITEGKDMPENCLYDCRLVNSCLHVPRWADAETLDNLKVQRADNCPLVEVPEPHGRLIDADAYEKTLHSLGNRDYRRTKGTIADAVKFLQKYYTPTIIEGSDT